MGEGHTIGTPQAGCWPAAFKGGLAYALATFGAGFVLGTVRILWLLPRVGAVAAVLLETPLILAASWWICGRCGRRFRVGPAACGRALMGATALAVLLTAEAMLSLVLGRSLEQYLAACRTVDGAIGLAGQLCFAAFPLLQRWRPDGR